MQTRKRPVTRSRGSGDPIENVPSTSAVGDVSKILTELVKPEKLRTAKQPRLIDHIKSKIDSLIQEKPVHVENDYLQVCHDLMLECLKQLIEKLRIVSLHRAGLLDAADDSVGEQKKSTILEEFLLFKEDCAAYLRDPTGKEAPVFVKQDYSTHALEEEDKILLTAQSVRRISARYFLAVLSMVQIPQPTARKLANQAAVSELLSDYMSRGTSAT